MPEFPAMNLWRLALPTFIAVVLVIGAFVTWRFGTGSPIQTTLHEALRDAKRVVVIVHSSQVDSPNAETMKNYKEQVFQSLELLPAQRRSLLRSLPRARDISDSVSTACIFNPHHRIEIFKADGTRLVWEICFICGEHFVEGDHVRILPGGWRASLRSFFESQNIRTEGL
jgi:hypothetical protein